MKRQAMPQLSTSAELALVEYEQTLLEQEKLASMAVSGMNPCHTLYWEYNN